MPTPSEVQSMLTGPGGPFEVVTEVVNGNEMRVYKDRMRSLREVAAAAMGRGDETFLVYGDRRSSFREFVESANSVSRVMGRDLGIGPGDRVAVLSANNPEWCLTFWGAVNLGAIVVGLNGWWKADEILYGLEDSGARVLVADRGRFERIKADVPSSIEHVFVVEDDFAPLLAEPGPDLPDAPIGEDDPAVIFYSSGTTGKPKGVISTHRSMIANLQNTIYNAMAGAMVNPGGAILDQSTTNAALLTSPLFHVSGCHSGLVVGLLAGVKLVIPVGRFEPEKIMALIRDEKINTWATVPTMVWRVCEHPARGDYDLSSVTTVAYGGSPSAEELQRMVQETFPNVRTLGNAYGLTESSSVATIISGPEFIENPNSVGRPLPIVDIRIVDDDGGDVATGGVGEVWIKGPIVMPGYWNKPEATAETLTPDGWLRTGDIGRLDDEGRLYITDRKKDMIIRGGENIYCVEIENRLVEHPRVLDAAVIGIPHPELGEEVKAVVQIAADDHLDEREVQEWVAQTLADFKVPKEIEFRHENLPRNASGKLLKNALRGSGEVSFEETM